MALISTKYDLVENGQENRLNPNQVFNYNFKLR